MGGEGVQQAFLRLLEGSSVTLSAKPPPTTGGSGAGKAEESVWDPNNPMNRSFGASTTGKKGVRDGLPGFGVGGTGELRNRNPRLMRRWEGRNICGRHDEYSFHLLRSFRRLGEYSQLTARQRRA